VRSPTASAKLSNVSSVGSIFRLLPLPPPELQRCKLNLKGKL
jgi:hypothetical protein